MYFVKKRAHAVPTCTMTSSASSPSSPNVASTSFSSWGVMFPTPFDSKSFATCARGRARKGGITVRHVTIRHVTVRHDTSRHGTTRHVTSRRTMKHPSKLRDRYLPYQPKCGMSDHSVVVVQAPQLLLVPHSHILRLS